MKRVALGLALLLTGCTTTATYRNPETGALAALCDNRPAAGVIAGPLILWPILMGAAVYDRVQAGNRYADCKTAAEAAGYIREGQ